MARVFYIPRTEETFSKYSHLFIYNRKVNKKYLWRAHERGSSEKSRTWYIVIAVVALGASLSSFIIGNILFALLIIVGAGTIMLAANRPDGEHVYGISEQGIHIDTQLVIWERVEQFAIREGTPPILVVDTKTMLGTVSIPLSGIDHRAVRTEFKNHNIEESDHIETVIENLTRAIGL